MATLKSWVRAARPRTLPLALSGILAGCGLAWFYGAVRLPVSLLALITATFIQIFSNFANDYGDHQKGTDNDRRVGPSRTVQSGEITPAEMKKGMLVVGGLSFCFGLYLLYVATWYLWRPAFFLFLGLGIVSLTAAYFYTAGKRSYGYAGLGDPAVFLFFGILPVVGAFYLNAGFPEPAVLLPAVSVGLFSTGVLNLNNMRDVANDRQSGKATIPVRIGERNARIYHLALIFWGWIATGLFLFYTWQSPWQALCLAALPLFLTDLLRIMRTEAPSELDPFLKRLSLSTLAFTLLFCTGLILATL